MLKYCQCKHHNVLMCDYSTTCSWGVAWTFFFFLTHNRMCAKSVQTIETVEDSLNSLRTVLPVCTTLHSPAPTSDSALTLTMYSVPAFSLDKIEWVVWGKTETDTALLQDVVPFLLYSTWYWEMAMSLWGVVQATIRAGVPDAIILVKETPLTLEGTVQEEINSQ